MDSRPRVRFAADALLLLLASAVAWFGLSIARQTQNLEPNLVNCLCSSGASPSGEFPPISSLVGPCDEQETPQIIGAADVRRLCGQEQETREAGRKFLKFAMFVTDGFPAWGMQPVLDRFRVGQAGGALAWKIDIPGPRYSHTIYASALLGQPPTNLDGHPISNADNVIDALDRFSRSRAAGDSERAMPFRYVGPDWPVLEIVAPTKQFRSRYFTQLTISDAVEYKHQVRLCLIAHPVWSSLFLPLHLPCCLC
jgi:hypothetical protein